MDRPKPVPLAEHSKDARHWTPVQALEYAAKEAADPEKGHAVVLILLASKDVGAVRFIRSGLNDCETVYLMERAKHEVIFEVEPVTE